MKNDKLDRILSKLEQGLNTSGTRDNDVWLAGYNALGENSARLIFGGVGEIRQDQVLAAVQNVTDGEMTAYAPSFAPLEMSARIGDSNIHYASIFAVKPRVHFLKATEDVIARCKVISSTSYLDTELGKVWDRKEINGESYLVRVNDMSPEDILKVSLMAKTDASFKVNSDTFLVTHNAKPGDYVEFFATEVHENHVQPFMDVAKVTANHGNALDIEIADGTFNSKATIPAHAVRTVAKVHEGTTRQDVMDFLFKAYGDKYKEIILERSGFGVNKNGKV